MTRYYRAYGLCGICNIPDSAVGTSRLKAAAKLLETHSKSHAWQGKIQKEEITEEEYAEASGWQGAQLALAF